MAKNSGYYDQLRQQLGALIDQLQLPILYQRSLQRRWLDQVIWAEKKAAECRRWHYRLRLTTIIGGVVLPALVGINFQFGQNNPTFRMWFPYVPFFLSQLIAVSAAIDEFCRFGDRWRDYRKMAEALKAEGWQYFQLSGVYRDQKNAASNSLESEVELVFKRQQMPPPRLEDRFEPSSSGHLKYYALFAGRVESIIKNDVQNYMSELVKHQAKQEQDLEKYLEAAQSITRDMARSAQSSMGDLPGGLIPSLPASVGDSSGSGRAVSVWQPAMAAPPQAALPAEPTSLAIESAIAAPPSNPSVLPSPPTEPTEPLPAGGWRDPSAAELRSPEPTVSEPIVSEPIVSEPIVSESTVPESTVPESTVPPSIGSESIAPDSSAMEPTAADPTAADPTAVELTTADPTGSEPTVHSSPVDVNAAIVAAANILRGMSSEDGPDGGNNACAWMVNNVLQQAGIAPLGDNPDYVPALLDALKQGRGKLVSRQEAKAGDLVIAYGEAHIGIGLDQACKRVLSNSSSRAAFVWESDTDFDGYYGGESTIYRLTQ